MARCIIILEICFVSTSPMLFHHKQPTKYLRLLRPYIDLRHEIEVMKFALYIYLQFIFPTGIVE